MILAINAGNTSITYGLFEGMKLLRMGRVAREDVALLSQHIGVRGGERFSRILMGSVVPSMNDKILSSLAPYGQRVEVAGVDLPWKIEIRCDEPAKVGADRLLNAIAAYARIKGACTVVDAGTAITVNAVSREGAFLGGAITLGPAAMASALNQRTELLPPVAIERPAAAICRNTTDAIRSGVYYGAVGMVEGLVARMRTELGAQVPLLVTGGAGKGIAAEMAEKPEYIEGLTLEGLAVMASTHQGA